MLDRWTKALDRWFYRDEAEYLERSDVPFAERMALVEALGRLNDRSGYHHLFLKELESILDLRKNSDNLKGRKLKIIDIGVGGGSLLRTIHFWAKRKNIPVELFGMDLCSEFAKNTQERLRKEGIPATVLQGDACNLTGVEDNSFDIALSSYMVHHIRSQEQVASFFSEVYRVSRSGWLIVDLERRLIGPAFMWLGLIFREPLMLISDGIKSVRRAYKVGEINILLKSPMHCRAYPVLPYWIVKGRKAP